MSVEGVGVICPRCGNSGEILDGIYEAIGDSLKAVVTQESIEKLKALKTALMQIQKANASPEQVKETITRYAPELHKLAEAVPKTPLGLNEYVKTICLILTTLIASLTYLQTRKAITPRRNRSKGGTGDYSGDGFPETWAERDSEQAETGEGKESATQIANTQAITANQFPTTNEHIPPQTAKPIVTSRCAKNAFTGHA